MISSNPLCLSTSSLDNVLKFLILSATGSSLFFNKGTSSMVITLLTQFNLAKSSFKLLRFSIVFGSSNSSFGV